MGNCNENYKKNWSCRHKIPICTIKKTCLKILYYKCMYLFIFLKIGLDLISKFFFKKKSKMCVFFLNVIFCQIFCVWKMIMLIGHLTALYLWKMPNMRVTKKKKPKRRWVILHKCFYSLICCKNAYNRKVVCGFYSNRGKTHTKGNHIALHFTFVDT